MEYTIIKIDRDNYLQHPQLVCFINPKQPSYNEKINWLLKRLDEGLRILLLYPEGEKKAQGYIEYVPGENCWRGVNAPGYMFIHCIWTYSNHWKNKGIATILLKECEKEARKAGMNGMAVLTGDTPFLTKPPLFMKYGFAVMEFASTGQVLMVKRFKDAPIPHLNDWQEELCKYRGWHIVYSKQCPWVARFVRELSEWLMDKKIKIQITELRTPQEAQHAPSPYAVFNLIHDGKLLADHYISLTRFANILKKEGAI